MQKLISLKSETGVTVFMRTDMISSFFYVKDKDITEVVIGPAAEVNAYHFPGDHTDRIINAIMN